MGSARPIKTRHEKNIYLRGFYDGLKEAEKQNKVRYASQEEHNLMTKKLKDAMKLLEDLLKEISL